MTEKDKESEEGVSGTRDMGRYQRQTVQDLRVTTQFEVLLSLSQLYLSICLYPDPDATQEREREEGKKRP